VIASTKIAEDLQAAVQELLPSWEIAASCGPEVCGVSGVLQEFQAFTCISLRLMKAIGVQHAAKIAEFELVRSHNRFLASLNRDADAGAVGEGVIRLDEYDWLPPLLAERLPDWDEFFLARSFSPAPDGGPERIEDDDRVLVYGIRELPETRKGKGGLLARSCYCEVALALLDRAPRTTVADFIAQDMRDIWKVKGALS